MTEDRIFDELDFLRKEVRRLRESLNLLTPGIDVILKRRGFHIYKKEPAEDLLLPGKGFIDAYYGMLHKYSFRLFLRDIIKHQDFFTLEKVTRYTSLAVAKEYLSYLTEIGLVEIKNKGYSLVSRPVKSFGETLEWYVAEVFRREFCTEAVWGVKFKRPRVGGDYDVIAKINGSIFYVEVKSSPPRQIYDTEIAAFLDRTQDLSPELSVFLMDTELRMKDKIVPMFEDELNKRGQGLPEVKKMEKELFEIGDRIFIINAQDTIVRNLQKVLNHHFRR